MMKSARYVEAILPKDLHQRESPMYGINFLSHLGNERADPVHFTCNGHLLFLACVLVEQETSM